MAKILIMELAEKLAEKHNYESDESITEEEFDELVEEETRDLDLVQKALFHKELQHTSLSNFDYTLDRVGVNFITNQPVYEIRGHRERTKREFEELKRICEESCRNLEEYRDIPSTVIYKLNKSISA